jgi:quercetin dioxygenase-like cupin family protein
MKVIDIQATLQAIDKLEIGEQTTKDDAGAAMKIVSAFNQCMVGLVSFSGQTPWERHPDDEFLQVLEGEVEITILGDDEIRTETLHAGSIFVIPHSLWHKQYSQQGVKLLFLTSQAGNEESDLEEPRIN